MTRTKKLFITKGIITGVVLLIVTCISIQQLQSRMNTKTSVSQPQAIYIGAWVQGLWDDNTKQLQPQKLKDFEKLVDKKMAIAHVYRGWAEIPQENFLHELDMLNKSGWMPMVSSNPYFYEQCSQPGVPLYAVIAQGSCDTLMRDIARSFKAYGKPVLFRFAWEINIPTLPWSLEMTKSTTGDYVSAWRRFHTIMKEEGATNVQWVFSPNVKSHAEDLSYHTIYPGDDVVDWVALDGYNWGTTQSWSSWGSFEDVFKHSYDEITAVAPKKPLMIAEINSTNVGGDQSEWLADALATQIPTNYPRIKAVVLFNEDKTAQDGVDWRIENSHKSIGVLRYIFENNPVYISLFDK